MFNNLFATLAAFLWVLPLGIAAPPQAVHLPEDEFVLPPYLKTVKGGILNLRTPDHQYAAEAGEWLDLNQTYNLSEKMAVQVLWNEQLQWVGGGVLKMKAAEAVWTKPASPYRLEIERGIVAVWVSAPSSEKFIEIKTEKEKFTAFNAVLWVIARPGSTEVYLHQGSITDSSGKVWNGKKYIRYQNSGMGVSTEWNAEAYKVKIAGVYSNLVKLIEQGQKEWDDGVVTEVYSAARKKGWRKTLRK